MTAPESAAAVVTGYVPPIFPLQLLEAVRAHDRPGEILEDEDLSVSLPRRLGLTGVIDTQIRRYQVARPWRRTVPLGEVLSLVRLVLRRPDSRPILIDTGRRLARARFEGAATAPLRFLPQAARLLAARRAARRLLRTVTGDSKIVFRKPFSVRLALPAFATLDDDGTACAIISGILDEVLVLWAARQEGVTMVLCVSRGDDACEWSLQEPSATG
jgi:hypothetical protein